MNATDEIYTDENSLEIGQVFREDAGVGMAWHFSVAGGPMSELAYMNKKEAFFGLLRVVYGKSEVIKMRTAKPIAAVNVTRGSAHVVDTSVRSRFAGRVLGIVTNVRTENDLVYITFDDFIELNFKVDDQLMIVE